MARYEVDQAGSRFQWACARLAIWNAGDRHHAACGLEQSVISRAGGHRPGLAKAGHGTIDQARIDRAQAFIVQAITLEVADLVIFDQDVRRPYQLADDVLPFRLCVIDGD